MNLIVPKMSSLVLQKLQKMIQVWPPAVLWIKGSVQLSILSRLVWHLFLIHSKTFQPCPVSIHLIFRQSQQVPPRLVFGPF